MKKAEFPPYAKIEWLDNLTALRVKWLEQHMKLSEFEEIIECAWSIMKDNKGYIWVSDMSDSEGVFPRDIMDFIADDDVAAKSNEAGLRWALTVMPKAAGLESMSTKSWNREVKKKDTFVVEQFPDWDSCKKWIEMNRE